MIDKKMLKMWLEDELKGALDPYASFSKEKVEPDYSYYEEAWIEAQDDEIPPWQAAIEDLADDLHNCGGSFFHRLSDIISTYHGTKRDLPQELNNFIEELVDLLYRDISGYKDLDR